MHTFIKKIINLSLIMAGFIALPVFAVNTPQTSKQRLQEIGNLAHYASSSSPLGPKLIILNMVTYLLGFVGMLFLVMAVYSGYQWISAGGNEEMITKAKTRLKNAIVGLGVTIAAYAITTWIFKAVQSLSNPF